MMTTLNKQQVIEQIAQESTSQQASNDKRVRLKGRINGMVANMVANANVQVYNKIAYNQNGGMNKGYIVESIVLDWAGLPAETPDCEVKFFGNDTPNILINESTTKIYIVVAKATNKGAYIIDDMAKVKNARLTLDYLVKNGLLKNHCESLERYLGLI